MSDVPEEPKKSAADVAYAVTKSVVSAVPVVGGPAAELVGLVFGPPLEKRREKWLEQLADAIKEIQSRVDELTPEKLSKHEAFITTALHATEIATRTHLKEKLEALHNAVVNSATDLHLEDDVRSMFLSLIDAFTPTHLRILKYFQDRNSLEERTVQRLILEETALTNLMVEELTRNGLLRDERPYAARGRDTGESLLTFGWTLSPLGSQFLRFISRRTR